MRKLRRCIYKWPDQASDSDKKKQILLKEGGKDYLPPAY